MNKNAQYLDVSSEYSNHLNTGLVWYSNGRFVSGCQMVSENWTGENLFLVQNVWYSDGPPTTVTLLFEYWTPIMSGNQMVTVIYKNVNFSNAI